MNANKVFSVTFFKNQLLLILITTIILFFSISCNSQDDNSLVFCAYRDENGDGVREENIGIFSLGFDSDEVSIQQIAQSDSLFQPAVLSPDGKQVAYINDDALYTVELTGGESKELAQVDEISSSIFWSKNGEALAFQSGTIQATVLSPAFPAWKIVSADGSGESKISALDFMPGAYKNYATNMYSPNGELLVIKHPDTSNLFISRIGNDAADPSTVAEIPGNYDFIEWSPDGKQLLLWVREDHEPQSEADFFQTLFHSSKATIYVVNADGSDLTQITALGEVASSFTPAWSPNGNQIIYGSWLEDTDGDGIAEFEHEFSTLFSINEDGSNRTKLLDETYDVTCADW